MTPRELMTLDPSFTREKGDKVGQETDSKTTDFGSKTTPEAYDDRYLELLKQVYEIVFDWDLAAGTVMPITGKNGPMGGVMSIRIAAEDALHFNTAYLVHADDRDKLKAFFDDIPKDDPECLVGKVYTISFRSDYDNHIDYYEGNLLFPEATRGLFCCRNMTAYAPTAEVKDAISAEKNDQFLSVLMASIPQGLIIYRLVDEKPVFDYMSKKALPYFGIGNADYVRAMAKKESLENYIKYYPLSDEEFIDLAKEGEAEVRITDNDYIGKNNNRPTWVNMTCHPAEIDGETLYYATITDITEQRYAGKQASWQRSAAEGMALAAHVVLSIAFDAATGFRETMGGDIIPRSFSEVQSLSDLMMVTRAIMHPDDHYKLRWDYDAQDWVDACAENAGHTQVTARLKSAVEDRGYEPFNISISYVEGDYDGSGILYVVVLALKGNAATEMKEGELSAPAAIPQDVAGLDAAPGVEAGVTVAPKVDVHLRTFGSFEVFIGDKPLLFKNKKSKELLALLVDRRGGYVTSEDAVAVLWPQDAYNKVTQSRYRKVAMRLRNTLEEYDIEHIMETVKGNRRIITGQVSCDLFDYLSGEAKYANLFKGSYLQNYEWAYSTRAVLNKARHS